MRPNSEARDGTSFGVLELTLGAERYEWRFRPGGRLVRATRLRAAATERPTLADPELARPGTPLNS